MNPKAVEKKLRLEYGRRFGLPAPALVALQKLHLLPRELSPVAEMLSEDRDFLERYSRTFSRREIIRLGLAVLSPEERRQIAAPRARPRQEWERWVEVKYVRCYRMKGAIIEKAVTNGTRPLLENTEGDVSLCTRTIYAEISKAGRAVDSEIRKKVNLIRRAAKMKVERENEKIRQLYY